MSLAQHPGFARELPERQGVRQAAHISSVSARQPQVGPLWPHRTQLWFDDMKTTLEIALTVIIIITKKFNHHSKTHSENNNKSNRNHK